MSARLRTPLILLGLTAGLLLAGCEKPPPETVQRGYRGVAMGLVYNPAAEARLASLNVAPPTPPAASPDGPKAGQIYKNLQVLGDLSVGEFARNMVAITSWVSPKEGCNYCHVAENYADDTKYTKVVARRMLQMTQNVNANWQQHVAATGVTCYTCHRGNPVPAAVWFAPEPPKQDARMVGGRALQNSPAMSVGLTSLPGDPFSAYLEDALPIRVVGDTALPTGNRTSTKQTEFTYGFMIHISNALGVNCTYCHNSRSFISWDNVPPQRAVAWYGIRMARELNVSYLDPLKPVFPHNRLGPTGDVAKVNCTTCHQGVYKPLYGAQMLKGFPELAGTPRTAAPTAAPGPTAGSGAAADRVVMEKAPMLSGDAAKARGDVVALK